FSRVTSVYPLLARHTFRMTVALSGCVSAYSVHPANGASFSASVGPESGWRDRATSGYFLGASAGEVPCWPSFLPSVAPFFFACFLWDLPSDVAASFFFSSFFSCVAKVGTESESATAKATSRVSSFFICLLSIWVRTTTRAIYAPQFPHSPPSQNGWSRERVF